MTKISVFFQGENHKDIAHCEMEASATFGALKLKLEEKFGVAPDSSIFLEDGEDPVDDAACISDHAKSGALKVHIHRRRNVEVLVTFNCETVKRRFSVSVTIARVKKWAAERKFGMSEEEASEHVLQISGTHDRPSPGTHLGTLVHCDAPLKFDLVPDERVNGAVRN